MQTGYNLDFAGMSPKQIRKVIAKAEKALKAAENREYYNKVVRKFQKKYDGHWVKYRETWSGNPDNWFCLVKIKHVYNVYHQDDTVKYMIDATIDRIYHVNLSEGYFSFMFEDNKFVTISEAGHEPKILTDKEVEKIRTTVDKRYMENIKKIGTT